MAEIVAQDDESAGIEEEYKKINNGVFLWQARRLYNTLVCWRLFLPNMGQRSYNGCSNVKDGGVHKPMDAKLNSLNIVAFSILVSGITIPGAKLIPKHQSKSS
jgi:hypothetical protein